MSLWLGLAGSSVFFDEAYAFLTFLIRLSTAIRDATMSAKAMAAFEMAATASDMG